MFLGAVFKEYWYWIISVTALCFLIPFLIKYTLLLFSRAVFVLRLSALSRKKGAVIKYRKCPVLSLFINHAYYDFCITVPSGDGSKAYDVKFFPFDPSKKNVFLNKTKH